MVLCTVDFVAEALISGFVGQRRKRSLSASDVSCCGAGWAIKSRVNRRNRRASRRERLFPRAAIRMVVTSRA
jgi:hypothetical protein